MTVVSEVALRADGNPARGRVDIVLAGEGGNPVVGYVPDGTIVSPSSITFEADGTWSADLEPNATITPSGTVYRLVLRGSDLPRAARYIVVPAAGPVTVAECLTDPPGAITPAALALLAERVAALESLALTWEA